MSKTSVKKSDYQFTTLLSGRLLAGNVLWSLAGAGLPLLVGLWAIPILVEGLGKERFGLLAIIWTGIGYFSFFDLGIGRALTKLVAEGLGKEDHAGNKILIRAGLQCMIGLGVIAAILVGVIALPLVERVLQVPEHLHTEARWSFWILAVSLPFVVSTAGLIGILQAHQRFRAIASVRIPLGAANFIGPVLVLPLTRSLVATTIVLATTRLMAWAVYSKICHRYHSGVTGLLVIHHAPIKQLLGFGGWITVSNIVSPIMVHFDRIFVGSLLGMAAVAYYTTPYEIVSRLSIIPVAVSDVIFPAFATALNANTARAERIFTGALKAQMGVMFPVMVLITLFASEGLSLWLGTDFSVNSVSVLRWLTLGVYINSFARLPFSLLQGQGRPDITAKLHLVELPFYLLALWMLTTRFGITGAAAAWTVRVGLDALILFLLGAWQTPVLKPAQIKGLLAVTITAIMLTALWRLPAIAIASKLVVIGLVNVICIFMIGVAAKRIRTVSLTK